ncbi:MAG: glycerol-3-phosphate 1-O-acyltransferase PlsY [Candidatus Aminicenantales bacterium]|jgi:glycerol-3-phosphate acyltransferase PlsY
MKVLFAVASYLLGSIPTGYLLVRAADRNDIRRLGSQSTGATNVLRVKGLKYALPVAAVDVAKGFLPVFFAIRIFQDPVLAALCGFLAVFGHCFPFSIGFRGGKGMATSMGVYAALAWPPFFASLALFVVTVAVSRFVSLGSILAAVSFPFFLLLLHGSQAAFIWSLAIAALVLFKHRDNIGRLAGGTERKLGEKAP